MRHLAWIFFLLVAACYNPHYLPVYGRIEVQAKSKYRQLLTDFTIQTANKFNLTYDEVNHKEVGYRNLRIATATSEGFLYYHGLLPGSKGGIEINLWYSQSDHQDHTDAINIIFVVIKGKIISSPVEDIFKSYISELKKHDITFVEKIREQD